MVNIGLLSVTYRFYARESRKKHYYELENACIMNHFSIPVKSFNIDLSGLLIFYDFD